MVDPNAAAGGINVMNGTSLDHLLESVVTRIRMLRRCRLQAICWLTLLLPALILCCVVLYSTDQSPPPPGLRNEVNSERTGAANPLIVRQSLESQRTDSLGSPVRTIGSRSLGLIRVEFPIITISILIGLTWSFVRIKEPTRLEAARLIEQKFPAVNDLLLTAVRILDGGVVVSPIMSREVLGRADDLASVSPEWNETVPRNYVRFWKFLRVLSLTLLVSSVIVTGRWVREGVNDAAGVNETDEAVAISQLSSGLSVEPGNAEVEEGDGLTIVAKFGSGVPTECEVTWTGEDSMVHRQSMAETLDSGVFSTRFEEITADRSYSVRFRTRGNASSATESGQSETYLISTWRRPRLERLDARIMPPAWAGRKEEVIEDTRRLSAIEGSAVTLTMTFNQNTEKLATIELVDSEGHRLHPVPVANAPNQAQVTLTVGQDTEWKSVLQDQAGRTSDDDDKFTIRVIRNGRPEIRMTFPGKDTSVSALQEFLVEADVTDDFGILEAGVEYRLITTGGELVDQPPRADAPEHTVVDNSAIQQSDANEAKADVAPTTTTIPLLTSAKDPPEQNGSVSERLQKASISHVIPLEQLKAQPEDLITWWFYADDQAADGTLHRTQSDIMFAEVRRFEEIFREAQQQAESNPPTGNQQEDSESGELLQIQKEIVSATWNILRTESDRRATGTWADDVRLTEQSQQAALEMLQMLKTQFETAPELRQLAEEAADRMQSIVELLKAASAAPENRSLRQALEAEQAVVRLLLKMRSAEHEVQRQQSEGSRGSRGRENVSEEQLQQLELDTERNRYETEKQAEPETKDSRGRREKLQILNRLRELARRQQMLNDRMRQLNAELRSAKTDEEKQQLDQELKRLRDDQREMLSDADEIRERMQQQAQKQNAESKVSSEEKVDQARRNMQNASENITRNNLSEAVTEGVRAERQMNELSEQIRSETSSQFEDELRQLQRDAKELSEQEQSLARELRGERSRQRGDKSEASESDSGPETPKSSEQNSDSGISEPPSLRPGRDRESARKKIQDQQQRLEKLEEQVREVIEQSEAAEPLLSGRLYETLRQTRESQLKEALEAAEFLAGRGLWGQSAEAEQLAQRGVKTLSDGIEDAARGIVGNENEALKRAASELQSLSRSLSEETQQAITGDQFTEWSDGLRDVEEMLADPELRNRIAQVRDRARTARADHRRHGTEPQWELLRNELVNEMDALRIEMLQDVARRDSPDAVVPLNREPVPQEFDSLVRRYYELLGRTRNGDGDQKNETESSP